MKARSRALVVGLVAVVAGGIVLSGCSGGGGSEGAATARSPQAAPAPMGTASIKGVVKYVGTPPKREAIRISTADAACHHDAPVLREDVVVNPNGTLRDVIVYVKSGLPAGSYRVTTGPAVLDQKGCVFYPHVVALQAGQDLKIVNSDDTPHNIAGQASANPRFNFMMTSNRVPPKVAKLDKPEWPPFKVHCDIHPWMLAFCAVFDHPYFAVTGADGAFEIKGLPAGDYTLECWQREMKAKTLSVKVGEGEAKVVEVAYGDAESAEAQKPGSVVTALGAH